MNAVRATSEGPARRWRGIGTGALLLLGVVGIVLQCGALTAFYFPIRVSSDYLYPHLFAVDVLRGEYPLSGWTLSSAPYFFPDFFTYGSLLTLLGTNTPAFAAYVAMAYTALAILFGASLRKAGVGRGAMLAGVVFTHLLLSVFPWRDHAHALWWLGTPGFHGGAVLLGLATYWLWAGDVETRPSMRERWFGTAVLLLGLCSDTLLLVQFVAPLGFALVVAAGRRWREAPRLRAFATGVAIAVAGFLVVRLACAIAGVFSFSKVVRYAPTPDAIFGAVGRFVGDVFGELAASEPAFVFAPLAFVCIAVVLALQASRAGTPVGERRNERIPDVFAASALAATVLLPLATVYWKDVQSARYLLPWLVLPGWWLTVRLMLAVRHRRGAPRLGVALAAMIILFGLGEGARGRDSHISQWPYPDQTRTLDDELTARGHQRGLSDYWNAHYLNVLSRAKLTVNQLRPDGRVQFWNNNAFWHYEAQEGRLEVPPPYTFIITTRLDESALREKYGSPAQVLVLGPDRVWLYEPEGAVQLTDRVAAEVEERVADLWGSRELPAPAAP